MIIVAAAGFAAVLLAAAPAAAQDGEQSDAAASTVRIQARLVQSGKVEFGLQLDGDRVWLPQARLFPYSTAEVGRWLFSSPYTLSASTVVRIQARLVESGKVEFGLQLDGDRVWLPQARLFPYSTAEVGRWLFSSPYTPGASTGETYCPDGPTHDGERWCVPTTVRGHDPTLLRLGAGARTCGALTRCGGVGYEAEPYYDSGRIPGTRTRACLPHRAPHPAGRHHHRGLRHQRAPIRRCAASPASAASPGTGAPLWTDVVYPVYLCSQRWRTRRPVTRTAWLPGEPLTGAREVLYQAWRDPDGRWRLLLEGRVNVSDDC